LAIRLRLSSDKGGGFSYTQFADTFQEANGLLAADRRPKLPLEHIARVTTESRMHIRGGA